MEYWWCKANLKQFDFHMKRENNERLHNLLLKSKGNQKSDGKRDDDDHRIRRYTDCVLEYSFPSLMMIVSFLSWWCFQLSAGGGLAIVRERRDTGDVHALDREVARVGLSIDHVPGQDHRPRGTLASLLYYTCGSVQCVVIIKSNKHFILYSFSLWCLCYVETLSLMGYVLVWRVPCLEGLVSHYFS